MNAPFPYFGGKSQAAPIVWPRLGDPLNFVEPFAGSLAILLKRPEWNWQRGTWADGNLREEICNDSDGLLSNAWRAIQLRPTDVAQYTSWIVSECDLTARHIWLINHRDDITLRLMGDPEWCDVKAAGWWLWGIACWIGSGWCAGTGCWNTDGEKIVNIRTPGDTRCGVNKQLVRLGAGAMVGINKKRVHLGDTRCGVNKKRVHMNAAGQGGQCDISLAGITDWMVALSHRLRRVSICCGDWSRVCGNALMGVHRSSPVGVFLDPPYADTASRTYGLYAHDSLTVAHDVQEWCIAYGDDPRYRICLAGYDGEHDMPDTWECVDNTACRGYGYGGQSRNGYANAGRERLWFNKSCLSPVKNQGVLF